MKSRTILLAGSFILVSTFGLAAQNKILRNANFCSINSNSKQVWQQMIDAKGGAAKLYDVRNVVVSSSARVKNKVESFPIRIESLYVFPKKWWIWDDQRPSYFGLHMSMRDMDSRQGYDLVAGGQKFSALTPIDSGIKDNNMAAITLELLLETKWAQPVPTRVFITEYRGQKTIGIETNIGDIRADFILDQGSCLPLQLITYHSTGVVKTSFDRYVELQGIEMPTAVTYGAEDGDITYTRRYEFDVQYDPDIFRVPPPFNRGPSAWKAE